ncbi:MAG: hypothetical protein IJ493_00195 [Clostridia bacterium]|nr:hypothetical protein [Clostridia bacterium]
MSIRIGVINWDCSLPPSTYFGRHDSNALSPVHFRHRTPYYAAIQSENRIVFPERTQAEYDRELQYAIDAGIDYFAYVWYGDDNQTALGYVPRDESDCSGHVWELTWARHMYAKSELRHRLNMCAIIGSHPFTDGDVERLVDTMKEPFYEHTEGRPLVYIFGGSRADIINRIRQTAAEQGVADPYVVALGGAPKDDSCRVEGLSAYACTASKVNSYAQLTDRLEAENNRRAASGLGVVPLFSMGWEPSPRIENPVPWTKYPSEFYAPEANDEEFLTGAKRMSEWVKSHRDAAIGHILTFAWNEFEEGGWICPTYTADGRLVDTRHLAVFSRIADLWRQELN